MSKGTLQIKERMRLAEFSLLMSVLGIDPRDYQFISREAQRSCSTDIEAIRREPDVHGKHEEDIVTVYLPSFKNYLPETMIREQMEESDYHPGEYDDKYLRFWSAFDTITYRFWISFHILKLRLLLYARHVDTELLFWARFGGAAPSLGVEERKYLLLLRFYSAYFRGRRLLYERVLPAFIKKKVSVQENVVNRAVVPEEFRSASGRRNSGLGRDFFPGKTFLENHSTFQVNVEDLDQDDVARFRPGGSGRELLENILHLFSPAHLRGKANYHFQPGLRLFMPGIENNICYLGFTTYLRETV
jgi:hypothetical protein